MGLVPERFGPLGRRSVTGGYPYFDFRAVPPAEALPAVDAMTLLVCMIETREGVRNAGAIAAVPGIDVNRVRRGIGIVFQAFNLFPHMSVLENVTLGPRKALRLPKAEAVAEPKAA